MRMISDRLTLPTPTSHEAMVGLGSDIFSNFARPGRQITLAAAVALGVLTTKSAFGIVTASIRSVSLAMQPRASVAWRLTICTPTGNEWLAVNSGVAKTGFAPTPKL